MDNNTIVCRTNQEPTELLAEGIGRREWMWASPGGHKAWPGLGGGPASPGGPWRAAGQALIYRVATPRGFSGFFQKRIPGGSGPPARAIAYDPEFVMFKGAWKGSGEKDTREGGKGGAKGTEMIAASLGSLCTIK